MPKFMKRPIEIEAIQIVKHGRDHLAFAGAAEWLLEALEKHPTEEGHVRLEETYGIVITKEGTLRIKDGDWLIRGVEGELYPCDGAIFAKTYDPVYESTVEPPPAIDTSAFVNKAAWPEGKDGKYTVEHDRTFLSGVDAHFCWNGPHTRDWVAQLIVEGTLIFNMKDSFLFSEDIPLNSPLYFLRRDGEEIPVGMTDWLIKDSQGQLFVCPDAEFKDRFDLLEEDA